MKQTNNDGIEWFYEKYWRKL